MKVSRSQLKVLGENQQGVFEQKMIAHLRQHLARDGQPVDAAEARAAVRAGMRRALHHGIRIEYDVGRFIDLWWVLGPGFDEQPPWAAILAAPHAPRLRVDQLCRTALQRLGGALREG